MNVKNLRKAILWCFDTIRASNKKEDSQVMQLTYGLFDNDQLIEMEIVPEYHNSLLLIRA